MDSNFLKIFLSGLSYRERGHPARKDCASNLKRFVKPNVDFYLNFGRTPGAFKSGQDARAPTKMLQI